MISYVGAKRDIKTMLRGLRVERAVAFQVKCYYGRGMTAKRLLARHRTAVVRRVSGRRSALSVSASAGELIVCLRYRGIRTFGSLVKRDDGPAGASRYVFRGLSMA